jgi:AraC-like DNA-binding protein
MNLTIPAPAPVTGLHAGLFVSRRSRGLRHPERVIDSHELIVVRRGTLAMHEDDAAMLVGPGEALVLTAGHRHGGTADYPPEMSFYWLHFTTGAPDDGLVLPRHSRPRRPQLLMELIARYLDDRVSGSATPATAGLLVHLILAELAAAPPASAVGGRTAHLIGRAEAWIGHHYHEPVSTSDVARALGCNADHLGRAFRQVTGRTLVQAMTERRMGEARRRLIDTSGEIRTIARDCGFADLAHFRRIFRRANGITPGGFRALHARTYVNSD